VEMQATPVSGAPEGPMTVVEAVRGPLVAGTFEVTPCVKTQSTSRTEGTLLGMRFLAGDDEDGNGIVDAGEWTLLCSAKAVAEGQWTVAQGDLATVSAFRDRYCIEYDWRSVDGAEWTSGDEVGAGDVEGAASGWSLGPPPD